MKNKLIIYFILVSSSVCAQEYEYSESEIYRSPIRKIANMFSLTVTTGVSSTKYKQDLSGFYYLQSPNQQYITENNGLLPPEFDVYDDWFNKATLGSPVTLEDTFDIPYPVLINPVLNPALNNEFTAYNADSLGLGFEGRGWSVPLNIGLRFNYMNFRVGMGFSIEIHRVNTLSPTVEDIGIRNYVPNLSNSFFKKFYGQLGYKFLDFWEYSFAGEIEVGKNWMGSNFNTQNKIYFNMGVSIEKNLSEYFRLVVKPSYDFRSYKVNLPSGGQVNHKYPAFNVSLGISITFPEIPRTPMKSDHVQLKHVYTDPETGRYKEVRGQPIWKKQNPKVGQNHRKLWRYKNKNKRKLNPY